MKRKPNPAAIYLLIQIAGSICFQLIFVASSLYQITAAGLSPLQLVLVGTTLEIAAFVFEVPTGVIADIYSRKLSVILGYLLMGLGFLVEGFFPAFLPIIAAQILWGLGYTFTSGAEQAWISDEIGEARANQLFVRAARFAIYASLLGMALAPLVGAENIAFPIRWGGLGLILIGLILIIAMPETRFEPTPREDRDTWQQMIYTFREGFQVVLSRPRLLTVLGIGFFYGLYSEGFDRLWVKHLIDNFEIPGVFAGSQVAFLSALRAGAAVLTILVLRSVEKRIDTSRVGEIGRAMLLVTGLISVGLLGFALSPFLGLTAAAFLLISILRRVAGPLYTSWVNQKLESRTRATVISISGQVDAIGQIAGGPGVGLIARSFSVVAALLTSASLLTPALWLVGRANSLPIPDDQPPKED